MLQMSSIIMEQEQKLQQLMERICRTDECTIQEYHWLKCCRRNSVMTAIQNCNSVYAQRWLFLFQVILCQTREALPPSTLDDIQNACDNLYVQVEAQMNRFMHFLHRNEVEVGIAVSKLLYWAQMTPNGEYPWPNPRYPLSHSGAVYLARYYMAYIVLVQYSVMDEVECFTWLSKAADDDVGAVSDPVGQPVGQSVTVIPYEQAERTLEALLSDDYWSTNAYDHQFYHDDHRIEWPVIPEQRRKTAEDSSVSSQDHIRAP